MTSIDAPRASIIARQIELYFGGQHRHCSGAQFKRTPKNRIYRDAHG